MPGSRERFITEAELDRILQNYLKRIKAIGGGASAFTDLTDVPNSYVGEGGKVVVVKATVDGLEFAAAGAGDMMKAIYDTNDDGVVDASDYATEAGDADTVDGDHAADFAPVSHQHGGGDIISQVGDSDKVDGEHASAFADALHKAQHESGGGADAIKLDDLAAPDDNTDLDVSPTLHGLAPKRDGDTESFLSGAGTWLKPGMRTLISELFDGLNTANILGQGSYTNFAAWDASLIGDTTAKVVVNAGADKMGQLDGDTVTEGTSRCWILTGAAWPWGLAFGTRFHCKMRTSDKTVGTKGFQIGTLSNADCAQVYFNSVSGGSLAFWTGTAIISLVNPINNNQWYEVDLFIVGGAANPYALVFIDGVQMGAPKACRTMSELWTQVSFYCNTTGTAARINLDFDDLQIATNWYWDLRD